MLSRFLLLLLALSLLPLASATAAPKPKKRYILYAQFVEETRVELSDGAEWIMDKGDAFPVHMFKDQQTKVVLELGGATFWTDSSRVRIMKESETAAALASYRKNLNSFLKSRSDKWKEGAKAGAK